jgi:hypothetical protein
MFKRLGRVAAVVAAGGLALGFGLNAANAAPRVAAAGLGGSTWTIHYTWTAGAYSGTFTVTLDTNHTATATGLHLKWSTSKSSTLKATGFQIVFENAAFYDCYANYDGTISKSKSMKGLVQTDDAPTYCLASGSWTATKDTTPVHPATVPGAGLRAAGAR